MADLEKLNIVIAGNAKEATDSLDGLIQKLGSAKTATGGLNAISESSKKLRMAVEGTSGAVKEQAGLFREAKDVVSRYYQILTKVASSKNDVSFTNEGFVSASGAWNELAYAANNAAERYENLGDIMSELSDLHSQEVDQRSIRALEDYAIKTEELANKTKEAATETDRLGTTALRSEGKLSKLLGTIKRVATMRLIRWAIRQVVTAAKEGLEILVEWDRTFGNNTSYAAKTVDELSAKWNEVKKAIGAAIMPLVQVLQPVLNFIMNGVIAIAEAINQVVRAIQGYSTYMKATYIYTERTTKQAKELRRVLFGFDELNVLNGNGGTGAVGAVSPIEFVETKINPDLQEVIDNIKNGKLFEAGDNYLDFNSYLNPQNMQEFDKKVKDWLKKAFNIKDVDLKNLDKKIMDFFSNVWEGIKTGVKNIGKSISDAWESIKTDFQDAWDNLKTTWSNVKSSLSTFWEDNIKKPVGDAFDSISQHINNVKKWIQLNIAVPIKQAFADFYEWILTNHPKLAAFLGITQEKLDKIRLEIEAITKEDAKTEELLGSPAVNDKGKYSTDIIFKTKTTLDETFKKLLNMGIFTAIGSKSVNLGLNFAANAGKYASGGDPEMGTLFWAGENGGAEVVATSPSGTGVMNMKQMQDAVSNGNIQVVNALGAIGNMIVNAINSKDTNAYLDGAKITDDVLRRANGMARATGQAVLAR